MKEYSIIIPTYNRVNNLGCVLMSLLKQRDFDFSKMEIIVADEGTMPAIIAINKFAEEMDIFYLWRRGTTGNPGQAKNWAVENARGEVLIFLDSDVILNDKALYWYDVLAKKYPGVIICGRYDWLPPMDVNEEVVATKFNELVSVELPQTKDPVAGMIGVDPRWQDTRTEKWNKPSSVSENGSAFALGVFGGNTLIPKELFQESGGFDPNIKGHGGEDACLGWEMQKMEAKAIFTDKVIGWHLYHDRPQKDNEIDVKKNIKYIEKKYRNLHIKFKVIADPGINMEYNEDGLFLPPEQKRMVEWRKRNKT